MTPYITSFSVFLIHDFHFVIVKTSEYVISRNGLVNSCNILILQKIYNDNDNVLFDSMKIIKLYEKIFHTAMVNKSMKQLNNDSFHAN